MKRRHLFTTSSTVNVLLEQTRTHCSWTVQCVDSHEVIERIDRNFLEQSSHPLRVELKYAISLSLVEVCQDCRICVVKSQQIITSYATQVARFSNDAEGLDAEDVELQESHSHTLMTIEHRALNTIANIKRHSICERERTDQNATSMHAALSLAIQQKLACRLKVWVLRAQLLARNRIFKNVGNNSERRCELLASLVSWSDEGRRLVHFCTRNIHASCKVLHHHLLPEIAVHPHRGDVRFTILFDEIILDFLSTRILEVQVDVWWLLTSWCEESLEHKVVSDWVRICNSESSADKASTS